jgi:methylated-DNA-[protein]-cysteine S-methyltransferase
MPTRRSEREGATVFPTAIGPCALSWSERGVTGVRLFPSGSHAARTAAPDPGRGRSASAALRPPTAIARGIERLQRHLDGEPDPLLDLDLDLTGIAPFTAEVYRRARRVRPGRTVSYGELAERSGSPGAARAVGQAMAQNPLPLLVPCHRVLAADGGLGGYSAQGGLGTKLRLLTIEGVDLRPLAGAGVRELRRRDPLLRPVIARVGPFLPAWQKQGDRFTALAQAIVHQQVSMKAGTSIFGRLRAIAGGAGDLTPTGLLALRPDQLRAAGLSRQKASYLVDLAARTAAGALPLERLDRIDDERVITLLTEVKGIGRWSAQMFLIFRLGRLDVLPVADLGLRKGVQQLEGLREPPTSAALEQLGARWAPFRSIATWYLWRSPESPV